ncbi:hypothetical protein JNUCC1_01084 [Lentibacillus sp. JNUCC-1]|uniref:beta-galactosidase n=1 Tax=Lentibacillus sp. JNUCC-1 TaxID=2654513 RepID=UPI0012E8FE61|nr:beta-galactosidase [Lentibacillus sp. JNUCC-1]MUV37278.1 hypothetical protein [Lentibacillus sp. JNUCC-1]
MTEIVLFYDTQFPFEGPRPEQAFFDTLGPKVRVCTAEELDEALAASETEVFVNLHGPYFPKEAWKSIQTYLSTGKGFVHTGGAPFRRPCYQSEGAWHAEDEQTAYHQALDIHETLPVDSFDVTGLVHNEDIPVLAEAEVLFSISNTYNFIMHPTKEIAIKHEMGSVGPMDARIYPLLKGVTESGREIAAPSVLIENAKGQYAGGRWVFINQKLDEKFWSTDGAGALLRIAAFVQAGVTDMSLKSTYATYEPGERATLTFQHQALLTPAEWGLRLSVSQNKQEVFSAQETLQTGRLLEKQTFVIPKDITPGFYEVTCELVSEKGETRILRQGFWGMDNALLQEGSKLTAGRDYFEKDGRPLPIVGMTYMTSDVARYFLFLPNPNVWDRDMAQMKRAGINYIRTGIWTAWRNMMFVDGHVDESVLRAIDAFILCARKHDLHVTFNFFSFTPEAWEGENPYLDPRSVEAQKRFITSIVSRHADTTNVDWDLINEPSLFDPERVFAGPQPLHDDFDRQAYRDWLQKRHSSIRDLQERWNMSPLELPSFDAVEPPEQSEINFGTRDMITGKKGLKWLDYVLYTMDMHNQWARELSGAIKQAAPGHLVTVGQDEALAGQRPSPFFYSEAVDYTTNHTWWLLDDLVWDGIFTKAPDKPNLIQETGIMYVETPRNMGKRSEYELRNILERKYAYAFSTGGAGAVQWLWNTNYFMDNINESNIGAIRADGTEKPETNVSYDFGAFMGEIRDLFRDRQLEEVGVVFPYSNDFSNRKLATDATTKLTRVLAYDMNVPFRAFGEYQLEALEMDPPKLLVVPSPHNFSNDAFDRLLSTVEKHGSTLLFTGPIHLDEYWQETARAEKLFGEVSTANVTREDVFTINDVPMPVSFGGDRIGDTMKGVTQSDSDWSLQEANLGKGRVIWSPLPVELNDRPASIASLYEYAMGQAQVERHLEWLKGDVSGIYGRKLDFADGALFIFVSEFGQDVPVAVKDPLTKVRYDFQVDSERVVMFATDEKGGVTNVYRPGEGTIYES